MMLQRTIKHLKMSIICVFVYSLAFACISICSSMNGTPGKVCAILVAFVFWAGLILGQVFFWKANEGRKKIQKKASRARFLKNASIGLVTFGSSKEAGIWDIVFVVSLITAIAINFLKIRIDWLVILILAVLLLSFNLHCILNGKTYRYIKAFHLAKKRTESK